MRKIFIASAAAIIATMSFATASEAGSRNRSSDDDGFSLSITIGSKPKRAQEDDVDYAPRRIQRNTYHAPKRVHYDIDYENDEPECTIRKTRKINRWGELVVKKIQVCE